MGASVTLVVNGRTAVTNPDGEFAFESVQLGGPEELLITRPGYAPVLIPLGRLPDGNWYLSLYLERVPVAVDGGELPAP